jgi:hypothetical protein
MGECTPRLVWTALETLLNGADPFPQYTLETDTGIFVPKALINAKGDLILGTADNTVDRKAVGANSWFV